MLCRWFRGLGAAVLLVGLSVSQVAAEEVPAEVKAVLQPALDRIKQAKTLSTSLKLNGAISLNGAIQQQMPDTSATVVSAQPNRMKLTVIQDQQPVVPMVVDGQHTFTLISEEAYLKIEAAKDFAGVLEEKLINLGPIDEVWFALVLAGNDPGEVLYEDVSSGEVVDREKIGDRPGAHVRLVDENATWDLWVTTDKKPEVTKLQADMTAMLRARNPGLPADAKLEFLVSASFSDMKADEKLADDTFTFKAPEGAKEYDSIAAYEEAMQPPPPLLGEEAPTFDFETMTGEKFDYAAHKGKSVILLDFWATWCGPCRKGLPIVAEVAKQMSGKGVVAYAVNLQEGKEEVAAFLKDNELPISIGLDLEGKVATAFQVQAIPHTVIIGKDGLIQAVHIGFSDVETYKATLTEELQALVDGKSLLEASEEEKPEAEEKEKASK